VASRTHSFYDLLVVSSAHVKSGALFSRTAGGCLVWRGAKNSGGYGYMRSGTATVLTHRLSYEIAYGPIPRGMHVYHRWESPICSRACAEPTHLCLGMGNKRASKTTVEPQWTSPPISLDVMVPRYLAIGVNQPEVIARALQVAVKDVREVINGLSTNKGDLSTSKVPDTRVL